MRNKIYCNATKGIQLANSSANEGIATLFFITSLAKYGKPNRFNKWRFYSRLFEYKIRWFCDCEGETYVGGKVVSSGAWFLTYNFALSIAQTEKIAATETTVNASASKFSACIIPLPVALISFGTKKQPDHAFIVKWSTASEHNNKNLKCNAVQTAYIFKQSK